MMVRTFAIDRMARWMATGLTTAGLSVAVIPHVHGGLFPVRKDKSAAEQSLAVPAAGARSTIVIPQSNAPLSAVGLRRTPRAATVQPVAPAAPAAAPIYLPQPMYFAAPAQPPMMAQPAAQVPQQYQALHEQIPGQENSAVARELRRLYQESGREAPQMPATTGQPQPVAAPQAQYAPQPAGYAMPPGYVAMPGYAPAPTYAPQPMYYPQPAYGQPVYAPQAAYAPQPGYAPQPVAAPQPYSQIPATQPITTDSDEDPEFFPEDPSIAQQQLGGFEFDESAAAAPRQPQQPYAVMPQPAAPRPNSYGFAYPGPAVQQVPTPIEQPFIVKSKSGQAEASSNPELPTPDELIVGAPIETDYEMSADPKIPKKLFGIIGASGPVTQEPPVEPNPYIPNPNAMLLADEDEIPLAPSAELLPPPPVDAAALAEIANFKDSAQPTEPLFPPEIAPPVVTPSVRTLPVPAGSMVGAAAARGKNYASELFKDEPPVVKAEPKVEKPAEKPVEKLVEKPAPVRNSGIARGGFAPGKNVVPEQLDVIAPGEPGETASNSRDLASSAAPATKIEPVATPYTGATLEQEPVATPGPLDAREHRGMFFPPVAASAVAPETEASDEPVPLPPPPELEPAAPKQALVQHASEAPAAPTSRFPERSPYTQSKYEQIASRAGATGLKGFCPVRLRDHRDLADGQPAFRVQHNGRVYTLSSAQALQNFLADPEKYVPAASGYDVVLNAQSGDAVEGSLDHSAWFKGRLYLFTSAENKEAFVASPATYAAK